MATISELKVAIGADISDFNKKFKEVSKSMEGIGKKMSKIGKSMSTYVTLPLAAAGAAAVKMASDVDKGLREVNTLLSASDKDFKGLQTGVEKLSLKIGVAQDVLTKGLYSAISAGVPKDNVFEFMEVASKAAIAGVTDTETAIDGITTTVNAFGLNFSQAEEVSNSMFAAVQGGKTTFEELSASLSNVAPAAASAKVSFQEVNAAIATLTAAGVPTAQATTQIRAALVGLQKPSEDMDAIFQSLGYSNAQMAIESEGLQFALNAVKKASNGNNGALTKLLGSVEAVGAANVLAGTSSAKFTAELERQKNSTGLAQEAFDEMEKSNSRAMEKMTVGISNAGIAIGNILLPFVSKLANMISGLVNWFTGLDASTKRWIVGIAAVVAAIGPLLATLGFFATTVAPAVAAGWVLMSGPIGWVIAGIAAAIAIFVTWKDEILASIGFIIEGFKAIPKAIYDSFKGVGKLLKAIFTLEFEKVPDLLKELGANILKADPLTVAAKGIAKGFSQDFGETVEEELPNEVDKIIPPILPELEKDGEKLGGALGKGVAIGTAKAMQMQVLKGKEFKDVAKAMFDALHKEFPKVKHKPMSIKIAPEKKELSKFQEKVRDFMRMNPIPMFLETSKLAKAFKNVAPKVGQALAKGFSVAMKGVGIAKDLGKGLSSVFTGGMEAFGGAFDSLISGDFVGAIVGVFSEFAQQSKSFSVLMGMMNEVLGNVINKFAPVFDKLVFSMMPLIHIVGQIADVMSGTLMVLLGEITKPIMTLLEMFTDILPVLEDLTNAVSGAVGDILALTIKAIKPLIPVFIEIVNAVIGVIDPLMNLITVITEMLMPVLTMFSEIIGGAITTSLMILAPILELIAFSLQGLAPIFESIAFSLRPIVLLFDLLAIAIEWLVEKISNFVGGKIGAPPEIPALAKGGIVNGPTTALIGEAGPEAVIPLSKLGGMTGGGQVTFRVQGNDLIGVLDNATRTGGRIG
jgi:TP901 family phage tail tape measure protein